MYGFQGQEWAQRTVSNFDSVLNGWVDSLPHHCEQHAFISIIAYMETHFLVKCAGTRRVRTRSSLDSPSTYIHTTIISRSSCTVHSSPTVLIHHPSLSHRWPSASTPHVRPHISRTRYLSVNRRRLCTSASSSPRKRLLSHFCSASGA